jgi:transposase
MPRPAYPYDVTDAEWRILELLVPAPLPGGSPPRHPRREIVNAILYVLRTGCQ